MLVLSPVGVLPSHQRRGVGSALIRHALAEASRAGFPAVFLEGSPDYYARLGFATAAAHGFTAPSPRIPPAAFQVALLDGHEDWMRGPLVYPDPFWELDCVGLR